MAIKGPWYITIKAVEQYCRIRGWNHDDAARAELAERDLSDLARRIAENPDKSGTELESGAYQFRGPRPLRLRMIVSYGKREEGDLPQLIDVKPDHEGRAGAYSRSTGADRRGGRGR